MSVVMVCARSAPVGITAAANPLPSAVTTKPRRPGAVAAGLREFISLRSARIIRSSAFMVRSFSEESGRGQEKLSKERSWGGQCA